MQLKNLLIVFCALTLLMSYPQVANSAGPEEGMVLYLPFNEGLGTTAKDLSPNGFEASLEGDYKWVQGKAMPKSYSWVGG